MRQAAYEPGHRTQEIPLAQRVTRPQSRSTEIGVILLILVVLILAGGFASAALTPSTPAPGSVWLTPSTYGPPPAGGFTSMPAAR